MFDALPTFEKRRFLGVLAVLTFGLTSLFAVLGLGLLVPATFVIGFLILLPLAALLGEDFPLIEASEAERAEQELDGIGDAAAGRDGGDAIAALRNRYATGEIDHAEFERRLDRLLETEDVGADAEPADLRSRVEAAELESESEQ